MKERVGVLVVVVAGVCSSGGMGVGPHTGGGGGGLSHNA